MAAPPWFAAEPELDEDMQNTLADLALAVEESAQEPVVVPSLTREDTNDSDQLDQSGSLQNNVDTRPGGEVEATTFEALCEEYRDKHGAASTVDPDLSKVPSSSSRFSTSSSRATFNDDLKVAERIAKTRGLPPDMPAADVPAFLLQYGYEVLDHRTWAKPPDTNGWHPKVHITLKSHIEFGDHTQYELICTVFNGDNVDISWRTLRRLKHIREGLHDVVKKALGSQYKLYFGSTPFARMVAPSGTTSRLIGWFHSLSSCINVGGLEPGIVTIALRLLDGPGTPLYSEGKSVFFTSAQIEQLPVTAAMFGSKDKLALPRSRLAQAEASHLDVVRKPSDNIIANGYVEMVFQVNGQDHCIHVTMKPLGVEFAKKPGDVLKVGRVHAGTHAERLGLQAGWTVKSVCGQDISGKSFQEASGVIKEKVSKLPPAT